MQVPLTPTANCLIEQMRELGYDDPALLIEEALERMAQQELADSRNEAPELLDWMRQEVAIGAEQAERGEFSALSLAEIKAQVLAAHQQRHGYGKLQVF